MKLTCPRMCIFLAKLLFVAEIRRIGAVELTQTKIMSKPGVTDHHIATPKEGDFLDFIKQSTIWVDKSMLIKHLLERRLAVTVISAPPGWGKTINLSMLKYYLQLSLNEDGLPSNRTASESYQYFVLGKITTNGTIHEVGQPLISGYEDDAHLGKYPVIYLNGSVLDMEEGIDSIRRMVHDAYRLHKPLFEFLNNKTDREKNLTLYHVKVEFKDFYEQFFHWDLIENVSLYYLKNSIFYLCCLLNRMYNQKVIVLFDNYDAYIQKAYFASETKCDPEAEKAQEFLQLFNQFKILTFRKDPYVVKNPYLHSAVFTSVLGVHEDFSDDYTAFYENELIAYVHYGSYCFHGISEPEILKMAEILNWNSSQIQNIGKYYGGYTLYSRRLDRPVYSTSSIAAYVSNKKVNEYWGLTYSQNFFTRMLQQTEFRTDIISLLRTFGEEKHNIASFDRGDLWYMEVRCCETVQEYLLQLDFYYQHKIFAVLILAGIVTYPKGYHDYKYDVIVQIPNLQIWNYLKDELVVSVGLQKHRFSVAESLILHYANNQDDLNPLPLLTESISKSLFNRSSKVNSTFFSKSLFSEYKYENERELLIEVLLKLMFQSALQPHSTFLPYQNNLPIVVENHSVLSLALKYCQSDEIRTIQESFNESLSCSRFFRGSNVTQYSLFKFLAVCINEKGRVDAMSLSIPPSEFSMMMNEAEKKLNHVLSAVDLNEEEMKKQKLNDDVLWTTSMIEQILKMYSSSIMHSFYNPFNSKISKSKRMDGPKIVYEKDPGMLRKTFRKSIVVSSSVELPKTEKSRNSRNAAPVVSGPAVLSNRIKKPKTSV